MKNWSVCMTFKKKSRSSCDWSPKRLQETQLGALGVPSWGFIYWYNATKVRKRDDSYDRVVHTNNTTMCHHDAHTTSHTASPLIILCHFWCHYTSTTGLALLLHIRQPHIVQTIQPVSHQDTMTDSHSFSMSSTLFRWTASTIVHHRTVDKKIS